MKKKHMKKSKMTDVDYYNKYISDWKETAEKLFPSEIIDSFMKQKERQFNLKEYKRQCKVYKQLSESIEISKSIDNDDFFSDL